MFRGVGIKLRQLFYQTIGHLLEETKEWLQERIANALIFFLETIEKHQLKIVDSILEEIEDTPDVPSSIRKMLKELRSGKYEAGSWFLGALGSSATGTVASGIFGALMAPAVNQIRARIPSTLLSPAECAVANWRREASEDYIREQLRMTGYSDKQINILLNILRPMLSPDELSRLCIRGVITKNEFIDLMEKQGFTKTQAEQILSLYRAMLGVSEYRELYLRREITEEEHDQALRKLGFKDSDIAYLKKLYYYIPSPSDLVRMAVREAWNDDVAEKFGYDEEFPEEFAEWAEKQGMSREWAKRYWRAHWDLPSPTMGYEMLHRGIITEEELDMLLKTADYPRFWREKLIKLSYSPYTRVDVRRMYQLGILSKEDVFKAYKDLGYDDEHARNLTEFTVAGASTSERDLTKSEILKGYRYKLLDREEAKEALMKMGYDEEEAEYYIALEDYNEEKERKEEVIKRTKTEFTKGIIDRNEVYKRLSEINLQSKEIDYYLSIWDTSRQAKPKQPSLADLKSFFKARVIDEKTFREELSNLGYSDKYIDWYVKTIFYAGE